MAIQCRLQLQLQLQWVVPAGCGISSSRSRNNLTFKHGSLVRTTVGGRSRHPKQCRDCRRFACTQQSTISMPTQVSTVRCACTPNRNNTSLTLCLHLKFVGFAFPGLPLGMIVSAVGSTTMMHWAPPKAVQRCGLAEICAKNSMLET